MSVKPRRGAVGPARRTTLRGTTKLTILDMRVLRQFEAAGLFLE